MPDRPTNPPAPQRSPRRVILVAATLLALVGFWWLPAGAWMAGLLLFLAGAGLEYSAMAPWHAHRRQRAVDQVTAGAEQAIDQALGAASEHSARFRAIVDTATEGIVTIDAQGRIDTWNGAAERLFGYPAAEIRGQNVKVLMPDPFAREHDGYLHRYQVTGERRIIGIGREVVGKRKDGSLFPIDLSVGEGWSGGQRFFTAIIRDISERKDMQTKLGQTERLAAVGELAAGVAHEVNNPINTIINCAQLIQDGDEITSNCQVIQEEGQRIADIVRDLLQFARDDSDRPQPTSLYEVVQRTLRLVGENLKRHGIGLQVDVSQDLPHVRARPQQVQQVLLNLLINAKDSLLHCDREVRKVRLSAAASGEGVELQVADNGPGIPDHLGQRIFEPFVTTKRARGGTGLGLSISKSIIEGYAGTLLVDSQPDVGATFKIWLPRVRASDGEAI